MLNTGGTITIIFTSRLSQYTGYSIDNRKSEEVIESCWSDFLGGRGLCNAGAVGTLGKKEGL